jgi:hypothetical protein
MGLSLDIANTRSGRRPSHVPAAISVPDSGQSAPKGGDKCTVIHGINMADEVLPPYVQFPSRAKEENYKLKAKTLTSFNQIKGQYGFGVQRFCDVGFGMNQKGGMTAKVFWYEVIFLCCT